MKGNAMGGPVDPATILARKLADMFPDPALRAQVEKELGRYGTESYERERVRVQVAILKVAGPAIPRIREWTDIAKRDYRDVLAGAEYPNQLITPTWNLSPAGREAIADKDADQYRRWLETPDEKVARVVKEAVAVVAYDPQWPAQFAGERDHLRACLPADLVRRIEHVGSTAVPGLPAKPIVDLLVEVTSLDETRQRIAPLLEAQGYDYFWRPSKGDSTPPFYAWFIKRDAAGNRTHHIHMVEAGFEQWDMLLFRDYLIEHPAVARDYGRLKQTLAMKHQQDRVAYTEAKTAFIQDVTDRARVYYGTARAGTRRSGG